MEFLIEYRLLGLFIGVCIVFDYRPVPPRRRQGGVLLGNAMLVGFSVARLGRHGRFAVDRQRASGRVGGGIRLFVVMDDQGTVRAARAGGQGLVSRQSEKEGKEIVNAGGATGMPVYGFPFLRRVSSAASACHLRPAKELSCRGAWIPLRAGFGRLRGPCGNSRFGTVLRKSCAVGQAQSLLIVRSGRSMPKRNVSRKELLYLACRFGRPEKVVGFGCK